MKLDELLLREWNLLLMFAVWTVMVLVERIRPDWFEKGHIVNRAEPLFPISVCTFCSMFVSGPWLPSDAPVTLAQKAILGVLLGAGAYNVGGLAKRFGLTPFLLNAGKRDER